MSHVSLLQCDFRSDMADLGLGNALPPEVSLFLHRASNTHDYAVCTVRSGMEKPPLSLLLCFEF